MRYVLSKGEGAGQAATPGLPGRRVRQPAAVKGQATPKGPPVKAGSSQGPQADPGAPVKFVLPGGTPAKRSPDYQAWLERTLEHEVEAHYGVWKQRRGRDPQHPEPQLTVPRLTEALAARADAHADFKAAPAKQRARDVFQTLESMKGNGKVVSQGHPLRWYAPMKKSLGGDEVFVIPADEHLEKGRKQSGPFVGPKGGKWQDPEHTIPWHEGFEARTAEVKAALKRGMDVHRGVSKPGISDRDREWLRHKWQQRFVGALEKEGIPHDTQDPKHLKRIDELKAEHRAGHAKEVAEKDNPYASDPGFYGRGLYASTSKDVARHYGKVTSGKVKLKNPLVLHVDAAREMSHKHGLVQDDRREAVHGKEAHGRAQQLTEKLKARGHDGVAILHGDDGEHSVEVVSFAHQKDFKKALLDDDDNFLEKGAMHKYIRRIPTGNAKRPWRYIYSETAGRHAAAAQAGEKIRLKDGDQTGHYEVLETFENGWVTMRHDETGKEVSVKQSHLQEMFAREYRSGLAAKRKQLFNTLALAKKHGSETQKKLAQLRVNDFQQRFPDPASLALEAMAKESARKAKESKTAEALLGAAVTALDAASSDLPADRKEQMHKVAKAAIDAGKYTPRESKFQLKTKREIKPPKNLAAFGSKAYSWSAITGNVDAGNFDAANEAYMAWKGELHMAGGTGARPKPWVGGELDAVNDELGLRKPERGEPDKRVTSPREAWDRLTAKAKRWDDPQVTSAIEIMRGIAGYENLSLPENVLEHLWEQTRKREEQEWAEQQKWREQRDKEINERDALEEAAARESSGGDVSFDFGFNVEKSLEKALYIGPRGGRWADPQHTVPYDEEKHGRKRVRKQLRKKPVTDNSQLDLDDLRRQAKKADVDLDGYFPSGSNHLGEIEGFVEIGWNVGVTAPELSPVEVYVLKQLRGKGTKVFVDSGAFSEVAVQKDGPPKVVKPISDEEWGKRLELYHELGAALGDQLYPVMPDQVGNQGVTLERLARYQHEVRSIRETGANIMCAMQLGPRSLADFDREVESIVGSSDYIRAIPMMKNAATPEQLAEFLDARPQVKRIHLLGLGPKGDVYPEVQKVLEGRDVKMTADSVAITAVVGRDGPEGAARPLTAAQDRAREKAQDDLYDVVFGLDYTDHIGQVNDWIAKPRRQGVADELVHLGVMDASDAKNFVRDPEAWLQAEDEDGVSNWEHPVVEQALDSEWRYATIGELRRTPKGGLRLYGGQLTTRGRKREGIKEWAREGGKLNKALYIGPRGGRWADPQHTIPYDEEKHGSGRKRVRKQLKKKPAPEEHMDLFSVLSTDIVENDPALTEAQKAKPKSDGLLAAQARDPGDPKEWKLPAGARLNEPLELAPIKPDAKWSHPDYGSGTGRAPWQQEGDEDWAPKLESYDWIMVNTSAGKDSQAMLTRVVEEADRQGYPREKIIAVHADLGRVEWEGTKSLAQQQAEMYGLRFEVVKRQQNDLIEQIEERYGDLSQKDVDTVALHEAGVKTWRQLHDMRPEDVTKIIGEGKGASKWEGAKRASELVRRAKHKRNAVAKKHEKAKAKEQKTIEEWTKKAAGAKSDKARQNALAKVRAARDELAVLEAKGDPWDWAIDWGKNIAWPDMSSRFCTADHKRVEVDKLITQLNRETKAKTGRAGKVLNAMGIRAQESSGRKAMDNFGRTLENANQIVDDWFPIHRWHEKKVWETIERSKVPHHKAYDLGMRRLSCVFCVFASREDIMVAAKHNPSLFQTYLELEEKVGASFKPTESLADVADEIKRRREAGYELSDTAEWVKKALNLGYLDDELVKAEVQGADPRVAVVRLVLEAANARLRAGGMKPTAVTWEWKGTGACLHLDDDKDSQHVEFLPYPLAYNASLVAAGYARSQGLVFEEHNMPPPPKAEAERLTKALYIGPRGGKWADPKHTIPWTPEHGREKVQHHEEAHVDLFELLSGAEVKQLEQKVEQSPVKPDMPPVERRKKEAKATPPLFAEIVTEANLETLRQDMRTLIKMYREIDSVESMAEAQQIFRNFYKTVGTWANAFIIGKPYSDDDPEYVRHLRVASHMFGTNMYKAFPEGWDFRTQKHELQLHELQETREKNIRKMQKEARDLMKAAKGFIESEGGKLERKLDQRVDIAGFNVLIQGGLRDEDFDKHLKTWFDNLGKAQEMIAKGGTGLDKVFQGLSIVVATKDRMKKCDFIAGDYDYTIDQLRIFRWGMGNAGISERDQYHTLIHEGAHRVFFKFMSEDAREEWRRFHENNHLEVRPEHAELFYTLFTSKPENQYESPGLGRVVDHEKVREAVSRYDGHEAQVMKYLAKHMGIYDDARTPDGQRQHMLKYVGDDLMKEDISEYGATDYKESFAEAFAIYVTKGPGALGPETRAMLHRVLQSARMTLRKSDDGERFFILERREQ